MTAIPQSHSGKSTLSLLSLRLQKGSWTVLWLHTALWTASQDWNKRKQAHLFLHCQDPLLSVGLAGSSNPIFLATTLCRKLYQALKVCRSQFLLWFTNSLMASALKVVNMATVADIRLTDPVQHDFPTDSKMEVIPEMSPGRYPAITPTSPATPESLKGTGIGVTGFDSPPNGLNAWTAPDPKVGWSLIAQWTLIISP